LSAITRRISGETWSQRPYSNSISRTKGIMSVSPRDGGFGAGLAVNAAVNLGVPAMAADAAIFVSKRLQRAAFAILCLILAQFVLASCQPEPTPMAARSRPLSSSSRWD
jgi:hypothetical protein